MNMKEALIEVFSTGTTTWFLLCTPVAIYSYFVDWPRTITCVLSLLALTPAAERSRFISNQLSVTIINPTSQGIVRAVLSNAVELIFGSLALVNGRCTLVQLFFLGSAISSMLLMLGSSFFIGGCKYRNQIFNTFPSQADSVLLVIGTMLVLFPVILTATSEEEIQGEIHLSRLVSLVSLSLFGAFIHFKSMSHHLNFKKAGAVASGNAEHHFIELSQSSDHGDEGYHSTNSDKTGTNIHVMGQESDAGSSNVTSYGDIERQSVPIKAQQSNEFPGLREKLGGNDEVVVDFCIKDTNHADFSASTTRVAEAEATTKATSGLGPVDRPKPHEGPFIKAKYGLVLLLCCLSLITILSNLILYSIQYTAEELGISSVFVVAVPVPILYNSAESLKAVRFALRNDLDSSLEIAVGSSRQTILFSLPFIVLVGWLWDMDMSLNFGAYEATVLGVATMIVSLTVSNGSSNWQVGLALVAAYVLVAVGFWIHKSEAL